MTKINLFKKEFVYIIIPVHNRKQLTLSSLATLHESGDLQRYHTLIVDDGSIDGTAIAIREAYPTVKILQGNGNLWWTGAIAKGMEYAFQQGAKYCIWLNDDCIPSSDTLSLLVNYLERHPDTIVGAACYTPESNAPVENGFRGRKRLAATPGEVVFVDGMSGYCVGIPSSVFQKIGVPDAKRFPHYGGDGMYILKATRAGFKACILGDAKVTLPGVIDPVHNFSSYLYTSTTSNLQSIFWNQKSPYYLPTQFFYHVEKHGVVIGMPLFLFKLSFWFSQWLQLQIVAWFRNG